MAGELATDLSKSANLTGPLSPLPPTDPTSGMGALTAAQIAERLQREQGLESQVDPLIQQKASMPLPKTSFQPDYSGGLFHNIGQALMQVLAATGPGQAIQQQVYGPGVRAYQGRQEKLANQISDIQGQQKAAEEPLSSLGRTMIGTGNLGEKKEHDRATEAISKERADTQAKAVANNAANQLVRQAQGWKNLDLKAQSNQIRQAYNDAIMQVATARINAGMDENSARISAQEDMKAALSQNQYAVQHPILSMLGISPDLGAAPGAQQPKAIQAPKAQPAKPAKQGGGGQHLHFDSQGNLVNK